MKQNYNNYVWKKDRNIPPAYIAPTLQKYQQIYVGSSKSYLFFKRIRYVCNIFGGSEQHTNNYITTKAGSFITSRIMNSSK